MTCDITQEINNGLVSSITLIMFNILLISIILVKHLVLSTSTKLDALGIITQAKKVLLELIYFDNHFMGFQSHCNH